MLADRKKGGLGIGSLADLNKALLAKWYWRYCKEKSALWRNIIDSIHGKNSWCENENNIKSGHSWKRIVKQWNQLKDIDLDPRKCIRRKVENGQNTKFWSDRWISEDILSVKFPRLYCMEINKNVTVAERLSGNGGFWEWRGTVRQGRTNEEFNHLKDLIQNVVITNKEDLWVCEGGPKNSFTVAWMRQQVAEKSQEKIGEHRRNRWLPKKIEIFMWRFQLNRLAVKDNLARMRVGGVDLQCVFCSHAVETENHIFNECTYAKEVWEKVHEWWGRSMSNILNLEDIPHRLATPSDSKNIKKVLHLVGAAVIRSIWMARNKITFKNQIDKVEEVVHEIQKESMLWLESRSRNVISHRNLWVASPMLALSSL